MSEATLSHPDLRVGDGPLPVRGLSPTQAAKYVGVSRALLYQLIAQGSVPARKLGSRTLVLVDDLDRFLEQLPSASASA